MILRNNQTNRRKAFFGRKLLFNYSNRIFLFVVVGGLLGFMLWLQISFNLAGVLWNSLDF